MQAQSARQLDDHNIQAGMPDSLQEGLPKHLSESIGAFLFLEESAGSFDVAVCMGCTCYHKSVTTGVKLYRSGRCRKLLFTGGPNPRIGGNEGALMAQLALEEGIPATDILVDHCATNTFENCLHARRIIQQKIKPVSVVRKYKKDVPLLAFVSIHYHSRRVCETYRMISGSSTLPASIPYSSDFYTAENWYQSERGRRDVIGELKRMIAYFPKDQCPETWTLLKAIKSIAVSNS